MLCNVVQHAPVVPWMTSSESSMDLFVHERGENTDTSLIAAGRSC